MKCNIYHPEAQSLAVVEQAIQADESIYRSPHVGNVNNEELSLIMGICDMGGTMQLEVVNTIRGDDKYSNPRVAIVGQQTIALASRSFAKGRIPDTCVAAEDGLQKLGDSIPNSELYIPGVSTLQQVHNNALKRALPGAVTITPSTDFFNGMGDAAYKLLLQEAHRVVQRPMRRIDAEGKIRAHSADEPIDFTDIYGQGESRSTGLLPPLEAMMAAELIRKTIEADGADAQIVHIGGNDMVKYTKLEDVMDGTRTIAERVLSDLGIGSGSAIDYIVPARSAILSSNQFESLSPQIQSQYDLLLAGRLERSEV